MQTRLCALHELHTSRGFELQLRGTTLALFLVRHEGQVYAYRNSCPHTGVELHWLEHQFLDLEGRYIQCASHAARFRIEDGLCVAGPCPGQSLQGLPTLIENGHIYLLHDDI